VYVGNDIDAVADGTHTAQEDQLSIAAAMQRLPEEQQLAVALVLVEGLSYQEAATVLAIPVGTLTSRLSRGRETLATLLGAAGATS
jgi:RNA polymerase sigma-70 factor (ECF subfamily)